jgi:hypothetical protein
MNRQIKEKASKQFPAKPLATRIYTLVKYISVKDNCHAKAG